MPKIVDRHTYDREPVVSVMRDEEFNDLARAPRPPWMDSDDDGRRRYRKRPGFAPVCIREED